MKCPARYMMIYDGGSFIDGIGYDSLQEAINAAEDTLCEWEAEQQGTWNMEDDKPSPTQEQIDAWDSMIYDCSCYVVEWDYENWEYPGADYAVWPTSDEDLENLGWVTYDELQRRM